MKYADETAFGHSLSIARWKPIAMERFITALHGYTVDNCDDHGNNGLWGTKSVKVDRLQTATVYYVPKDGTGGAAKPIGMPVLLTLTNPGGKVICMEYVPEPWDYHQAPELNREAFMRGSADDGLDAGRDAS